ncbi:MAG TPA: LuxR C-terminal-related transcriptional regulator [Terriglobales bacterium]
MLPTKAGLSKLLAALYDAAADSSLWLVFLRELANATRSSQSGILLHDLQHGHHSVSLDWGIDAKTARLYQDYYGARDIWMQRAAPLVYSGWMARSEDICAFEELSRSEFYNDFLQPQGGFAHAMWGVIEKSPSKMIGLGLYRDRRRQPFESRDLQLLSFLAPHLQRAFRLHMQVSELKAFAQDLEHAVDMLPTAIVLLGNDRRILHTNKSAAKILADNDGLLAVHQQLQASHPAETARLDNLICQAQATSTGNGLSPGGGIKISRRIRPALEVVVTPVRHINLGSSCPVHAIAFVVDPTKNLRPAADILRAIFGLTPAECRVALLLGDGLAPRAIAELIGVSANTLKTQLASIYRKTGTSRQGQLVRMLSQLAVAA